MCSLVTETPTENVLLFYEAHIWHAQLISHENTDACEETCKWIVSVLFFLGKRPDSLRADVLRALPSSAGEIRSVTRLLETHRLSLTRFHVCLKRQIIAPWRIPEFYKRFHGRKDLMEYAEVPCDHWWMRCFCFSLMICFFCWENEMSVSQVVLRISRIAICNQNYF